METPSAFPATSSSSPSSAGTKFFSRIANGNRFFWTLFIFSLFKILGVVFSGFGLVYPCLLPISAYESKDAGKKKAHPKVLRWQEFKLKVYSLAHCVFNVEIPRRYVDKCYEKLIKANESVPDAFVQEIPTIYDAHLPGFDCEKFFRDFVKRPHPVVLKGFAKETAAATQWTLDSLIARFGEDEVKLKTKDGDNVPGIMKDLNTFPNYLHNCESLFLEHPELAKQLQVNRLEKLAGNKRIANDHPTLGPLPLQLFAGRGGTGTAFHCANAYNFFFQIEGVKKWTFVDPRWTMFMFPAINRNAIYQSCAIKDPNTVINRYKPLWRVEPRYSAVLERGDVLLNPPWWWHCIENLSDSSVAVATRWADSKTFNPITGLGSDGNRLFTSFQLFSPIFVKMTFSMFLAGTSGLVPEDETEGEEEETTRRSKQGVRFEQGNRMLDAFNENAENDAYKAYYANKKKSSETNNTFDDVGV